MSIESGVMMKKEYTKLDIIKADIAALLMQYENKGYQLGGDFYRGGEFRCFFIGSFNELLIRVSLPFERYIMYGGLENAEIKLEIIGNESEFKPLTDMLCVNLSKLEQRGRFSSCVLNGNCWEDMLYMLIGCITLKVINRELNNLLEDIAKEMEC